MYKVYKITNLTNNKSYIGQTSKDFIWRGQPEYIIGCEARYCNNIEDYHSSYEFRKDIKENLLKSGHRNIKIEILEANLTQEKADERERYWINKFDTYNSGYNEQTGGKSSFIQKLSEDDIKNMSRAQKERWSKTSNERRKELGNIFSKAVKKYWDNANEEDKKERFKHVSETRIKNGIAKGKNNPMYGVHRYGKDSPRSKKIICITTGEIFDCAKYAKNKYGGEPKNSANKNNITKCTIDKNNKSQKLSWVYLQDYKNEYSGILIKA